MNEGTEVGLIVGITELEGTSLLACDGQLDFDGATVGKRLGSVERVERLEGKLVGRTDCWDGVEEGRLVCKLVPPKSSVGLFESEGVNVGLLDPWSMQKANISVMLKSVKMKVWAVEKTYRRKRRNDQRWNAWWGRWRPLGRTLRVDNFREKPWPAKTAKFVVPITSCGCISHQIASKIVEVYSRVYQYHLLIITRIQNTTPNNHPLSRWDSRRRRGMDWNRRNARRRTSRNGRCGWV